MSWQCQEQAETRWFPCERTVTAVGQHQQSPGRVVFSVKAQLETRWCVVEFGVRVESQGIDMLVVKRNGA